MKIRFKKKSLSLFLSTIITIPVKTESVFAVFKEKVKLNDNIDFAASSERFKQFKVCHLLHNVKVSDEFERLKVGGKATKELLRTIDKLIVEENCLPEQMFNINETRLF